MAGHPHGTPRASSERASAPSFMRSVDFAKAPFLVIWETTQSCALACRHCRASAQPGRDPRELTTAEGCRVIDEVADLGTPIMILSGGDPVNRPDLLDLIRHGKSRGLRMATIPAATDCLTRELVQSLKAAGCDQMAVSIDFPRAELHDGFRGVPGAFDKDHAGRGVGARGRAAAAGQHHADRGHRAVPRGDGRLRPGPRHRLLGGVLPGADGAGKCPHGPQCGRVRAPVRGRLQGAEDRRLHREGDGGPALPASRRAARDEGRGPPFGASRRARRHAGAAHRLGGPGAHRGARAARRQLGQRFPVRLAPGRDHAERLPADPRRQRARDEPGARLPRDAAVPAAADALAVQGPLRPLRVPRHLRRLALARLRPDGRSVRDGSLVQL